MKIKRGLTSVRRLIFIADTSSTTGAGLANLVYNSSGLVAYYFAGDLNNEVQISLVTATLGIFASGGFIAVDNTNMPGWYEIGIPDAALDAGNEVAIQLRGATNMAPVNIYIELDTVDYQTDAFGALKPTTAGRTLDVTSTGEAGIDWANIGSPTTSVNLSGTSISTSQAIASVSGAVGSVTSGVTVSTNNDKTGYSLTQAFPSNFSSLAIAAGTGAVTVNGDAFGNTLVLTNLASQSSVDTLAGYVDTEVAAIKSKTDNLPASPAAVGDIPTANQNRDAVLNAMPSAGYVNGSFGDRMLISTSDQREVAITGSNHIAADVHEFQAGVITAGDFAAGAIDANALAADAATEIATAVAATQALSRLDSMIESDGAGQFRFDTIALSMAPAGGGGGGGTDWTSSERTAIRSILGFDASGTVSLPTVGVMDAIKDKTDLITSDGISVLEDRVNESTITMQYNESTTASVNLDEDTTSATLQFVVSRPDGTDILTIANGSITRTASSFTVTITTAVTATLGQYLWSLRDITSGTNRVVTKGVLTVQNAASA
jgi:hypothetical protein